MSDTPKTDAATHDDWSGGAAAVEVETAKELEREWNRLASAVQSVIDRPDYTNPEGIIRRLKESAER